MNFYPLPFLIHKRRWHSFDSALKLLKENIFATESSEVICLMNVGYSGVGGVSFDEVEQKMKGFLGFKRLVMTLGKPFSFVFFQTVADAETARSQLDNQPCLLIENRLLFVEYVDSSRIPESILKPLALEVPGLTYLDNFITIEEEIEMIKKIRKISDWKTVKNRKIKHFGYEFDYQKTHAGIQLERKFPPYVIKLLDRFYASELGQSIASSDKQLNQLTISDYPPGTGIPPHCDSHTAFHETILIFSLESSVIMEFRDLKGDITPIELKPRSLAVFRGEVRYGWEHAIRIRKSDVLSSGLLQLRQPRISFTIRRILESPGCSCSYPSLCDRDRLTQIMN